MRNKSYIAVFLIGLFSASALQLNAQNKKQTSNEQKEAAKLERKERRLQLISYLDGISQKAVGIEPVEDRVRVLTEVGDAFWFLDKPRAISSFTQLFQTIDGMASEAGAETNKINALRQATLARVARRDPELAAKLITNEPAPVKDEPFSRELNAMSKPHAETLTAVALTLLKTDLQQSISLARLALRDGMSQTTRTYLLRLREIDAAMADSLLELSLKHAATQTPARLFDALSFWEYAFQPSGFHFGPVSWSGSAEGRSYGVSQPLKLAVLQFAVSAINQNIQLRLATGATNTRASDLRLAQLYSVVQQLLPHIAQYIPPAADALRAELGVLEQAVRGSGQQLPALRSFGSSPEQTSSAIENLLQKAERTIGGKERDGLYLAATYRLLFAGQFEKAAAMASRMEESEMKTAITDAINFNWTGSLLASGNITEALTTARTIRAHEPKVVALAKAGAVVETGD